MKIFLMLILFLMSQKRRTRKGTIVFCLEVQHQLHQTLFKIIVLSSQKTCCTVEKWTPGLPSMIVPPTVTLLRGQLQSKCQNVPFVKYIKAI